MRRQLAITAAATTALVTLAFVIPLGLLVRTVAEDRARTAAQLEAQSLVAVLATVQNPGDVASVVSGAGNADRRVSVFLADGTVLGVPGSAGPEVERARRTKTAFSVSVTGGEAVFQPVDRASAGVDVIEVFVPDSALRRGVVRSWVLLGGLGLALVVLGTAVADWLGRSVVRPMGELANVARRLSGGELDARVPPAGPREVEDAGQALNVLASRIGDLLAAEREGVADLSHRLRTPLAGLRLEAEALRDTVERTRVQEATDEVARSVDRLIDEARRPLRENVRPSSDLVALVRERAGFWAPLADDEGRTFDLVLPTGPVLVASASPDVAAAIDALIGNVLAHTPEGTAFRIEVISSADGARLTVSDDGPGIADASVVERGVSGAGSTGLGLDIVRRTAEAAGGRLQLRRAPGGGALVEVSLGRPTAP
jgi:signal transduction histidine kinase